MKPQRSWWIRFVELFLLWVGGRAIFFAMLTQMDPNLRRAVAASYSPILLAAETVFGALAIGAAVAIYVRYRHALMMATAALAIYTGITIVEVMQASSNLPALRQAYKESREARGTPIPDDRLDIMFSEATIPVLWVTAGVLCIPPYVILLWRKHELEPVSEQDEPAA